MSRYVEVGLETGSYGDGTGTPAAIKVTSISYDIDRGVLKDEVIDSYVAGDGYPGPLKITGSFECNLRPMQFENVIYALMGTLSAGSPNAYTLGEPKAMILNVGDLYGASGGVERQFAGVGIKSGSFTFEAKELVKASFDFVARSYLDAAYSFPSYTSENPAICWGMTVSIGGSPVTSIKEMTLEIDRKIDEEQFVIGSFYLNGLLMTGVTEVGGTLTFTESQYAEIKRAIYGTTAGTTIPALNTLGKPAITITCTDTDGTTALVITMPVTIYTKQGTEFSGKDEAGKTVDYIVTGSAFQIDVYTIV